MHIQLCQRHTAPAVLGLAVTTAEEGCWLPGTPGLPASPTPAQEPPRLLLTSPIASHVPPHPLTPALPRLTSASNGSAPTAAIVKAVDEGHNVNEVEASGNTPLHFAAFEGWVEG